MARNAGAIPSTTVDSSIGMGAATAAGNQATYCGGSEDAAATMDTVSHCQAGECVAILNGTVTAIVSRATFVQFNADGFRLNWTEVSGVASNVFYIAIAGGSWLVGDLLTQTDTVTAITESGFGFQPAGAMFISACAAEDASDTLHANDQWTCGAFASATERGTQGMLDEDNVADSEVSTAVEFDELYVNISTASTVQGLMDVQSVDGDGFTNIMDGADSSQSFVWYLTGGNVTAAGWEQLLSHRRSHLVLPT